MPAEADVRKCEPEEAYPTITMHSKMPEVSTKQISVLIEWRENYTFSICLIDALAVRGGWKCSPIIDAIEPPPQLNYMEVTQQQTANVNDYRDK